MTTTTATQLRTTATLWTDLQDALSTPNTTSWPPAGLRTYLTALEQHDATEAAALRALERNPDQLGARPVPISLRVYDTMRSVEAGLHECATQIAAANQSDTYGHDHPHRWHFTGQPRGAAWVALWLAARADGVFWPGKPLSEAQERHVGRVAREALHRVEAVLDLADGRRELTADYTCPCGGAVEIRGGAGAAPRIRCTQCGAYWTEAGVVAA